MKITLSCASNLFHILTELTLLFPITVVRAHQTLNYYQMVKLWHEIGAYVYYHNHYHHHYQHHS